MDYNPQNPNPLDEQNKTPRKIILTALLISIIIVAVFVLKPFDTIDNQENKTDQDLSATEQSDVTPIENAGDIKQTNNKEELASEAPIQSVKNFFNYLATDQIETAYLSTSSGFQENENMDSLTEFFKNYPFLKSIKDLNFVYKNTQEESASLSGALTAKDGTSSPVNIDLIKENGQWKISSFDLYSKEQHDAENQAINESNKFLDYLVDSNFYHAYQITSSNYQHNTSQSEFEDLIKSHPLFISDNSSVTDIGEYFPDKIILYVDVSHEENLLPIDVTMVKEDNNWRI